MIALNNVAPQHGPRPLPLFLSILWRETENDPELRQLALAGVRKYQEAIRPDQAGHVANFVAHGRAKLLHKGNAVSRANRSPVVLIPSLVNPPHILDLSPQKSLVAYLAARGHDPWLVDWGTPSAEDRGQSLADHVTHLLIPLLKKLDRPPILAGYCLGGTLAIAAAPDTGAKAVVTIAAPWDFASYPAADTKLITDLWTSSKQMCERLGYIPMEVLQSGFWALDPGRTIRKYAAFAEMAEGSAGAQAFIAVEDWANEGAPLTHRAGADLFEQFYAGNATGRGDWQVAGCAARLSDLEMPSLSIKSSTDKIVPAAASPMLQDNLELSLGHVGMIVSERAPDQLWKPLSDWLSIYDRSC
ncbi:MAG: alpha/beta fold hydrolase [Sphingobium sp.]